MRFAIDWLGSQSISFFIKTYNNVIKMLEYLILFHPNLPSLNLLAIIKSKTSKSTNDPINIRSLIQTHHTKHLLTINILHLYLCHQSHPIPSTNRRSQNLFHIVPIFVINRISIRRDTSYLFEGIFR